ncbi:hypothetical protein [Urechidicola vernalis]|uniref:Uncharacterized protein n=1 Tax=Urechidicola vernalis TaxID=3075600 RepID=A0ABU2Y8B9_9FLAO|nr:hypothetical protein [Urechidicola sp. P050]MDT0553904.1 hypothetical protein [Urechidicola sp. P050]
MELLIFKTDIKSKKKIKKVKKLFNTNIEILDWGIDLEDVDNVLRIEGVDGIDKKRIIKLTETDGFCCEQLT